MRAGLSPTGYFYIRFASAVSLPCVSSKKSYVAHMKYTYRSLTVSGLPYSGIVALEVLERGYVAPVPPHQFSNSLISSLEISSHFLVSNFSLPYNHVWVGMPAYGKSFVALCQLAYPLRTFPHVLPKINN